MKKLLPILLFAGFSSPAFADITHKLSSSIQLQVNAAATQVKESEVHTLFLEMVLIQQMVQLLTQFLQELSQVVLWHQVL